MMVIKINATSVKIISSLFLSVSTRGIFISLYTVEREKCALARETKKDDLSRHRVSLP